MRRYLAALAFLLTPVPGFAQCGGANLLDALPPVEAQAVADATAAQPYAVGNLWRATKDGTEVTLVGTYHYGDTRHDTTLAAITPMVTAAKVLLVEAGPKEEKALTKAAADNPGLMFITEGPSLLEQLGPDDWETLKAAMQERGMPGFMVAKFKPWYVSMMLSLPTCGFDPALLVQGLDKRVIALADDSGVPVQALEPFDTIFNLFANMPQEDQLNMIRQGLLYDDMAADMAFTLVEEYFAENSRAVWEYSRIISRSDTFRSPGTTPEQADAEFGRLEEVLINARNRAWIPVIQNAAKDGPVFVAFGALHLSGEQGVLNLLHQQGWDISNLTLRGE